MFAYFKTDGNLDFLSDVLIAVGYTGLRSRILCFIFL